MSTATVSKKKGFFGRFRKSKKSGQAADVNSRGNGKTVTMADAPEENPAFEAVDEREMPPSPAASMNSKSRDDIPEAQSEDMAQKYSERSPVNEELAFSRSQETEVEPMKLVNPGETAPPSAREAAFSGPPRFDWIDVETTAATKVQAAFRRFQVMRDLEEAGKSTSAIRNRRRRRKAAARFGGRNRTQVSEDAPSIFNWCGVGLVFGDATEEDDEVYRQLQKSRYEEKRKEQAAHEEALRRRFLQSENNKAGVVEAYEVVGDRAEG
eukprot:CAMPEP_0119559210 /NCGR_PEP_ID=MMETSP1352-20130426/12218_1 /TAXON_ID=265584 /ORGANISM="Stauroneis constricta, Strain CCMP1120" /LENGTH=266 /DNA_ID=CAMNT_0007606851 /DNA_START=40 /DNA_END=840 /DNA_ORIENTATION=-